MAVKKNLVLGGLQERTRRQALQGQGRVIKGDLGKLSELEPLSP